MTGERHPWRCRWFGHKFRVFLVFGKTTIVKCTRCQHEEDRRTSDSTSPPQGAEARTPEREMP